MQVVAYARAVPTKTISWELGARARERVRSGVVVAEYFESVGLGADGDGAEEGEEVSGAADRGLTDET